MVRRQIVGATLLIVSLALAVSDTLLWVSGWREAPRGVLDGATSAISARQPQTFSQPERRSHSVAIGASVVVSMCVAFAVGQNQRRSASTRERLKSRLVAASETGNTVRRCPKTGGPVCFCNHNAANGSSNSFGACKRHDSVRSNSSSVMPARAVFPGTDVVIDAAGVSFPLHATCEVGEAGRSCDGAETKTGVAGVINFTQTDANRITIDYDLHGLTPGSHGFHVHEKADFSNGCASAGPHYNPFNTWHGGPDDLERHVGDLGNVCADSNGIAKGTITDRLVKIFGDYTVVGRSVMIHADEDDFGRGDPCGWPDIPPPPAPAQHTKTTGNAGARIACGVIVSD